MQGPILDVNATGCSKCQFAEVLNVNLSSGGG